MNAQEEERLRAALDDLFGRWKTDDAEEQKLRTAFAELLPMHMNLLVPAVRDGDARAREVEAEGE